MALAQSDWGGGVYRGRKAPANSVFDAVNALVNDEGLLFRRGGSAYKSAADAGSAPEGLIDTYVAGGQRTVFWSQTGEDMYVLDADDSSVVVLSTTTWTWRRFARGVVVGGLLWLPGVESGFGADWPGPIGYGGSRKTADTAIATINVTNGSTAVTTALAASGDAGMILLGTGGILTGSRGVVRRIISGTQLELVEPWTGATASAGGMLERFDINGPITDVTNTEPGYVATAGGRLLWAQGTRIYFAPPGNVFGANFATDFHQLPDGSLTLGADGIHNTAMIFTTAGVWAIANLELDPVDDAGNIQHIVSQVSKDVILWGDPGIAAWESVLVVPAADDVYLLSTSGQARPISGGRSAGDGGIRSLYRGYVAAGYQPGMAAVHRAHYLLPILSGTTLVDMLMCRLDRGFAWTRWSGHAASIAYAQRVGATTRSPKLLGVAGQRVIDLTGCLDATGAVQDADATDVTASIITQDYPMGDPAATVARANLTYEMPAGLTDDFDRPDEAELAAPWLDWTIGTRPALVGGLAKSGVDSDATRPESIGPDCFTDIILGAAASLNEFSVGARLSAHGPAATGYMVDYAAGGHVKIYKLPAFTEIASSASSYAAGIEGLRIVCAGTTITGYARLAGVWTQVVQVTDATYVGAGFPGFFISAPSTTGVDSFTWGPVVAGVPAAHGAVNVAYSSDRDAGVFTTLTQKGVNGSSSALGGGGSDGSAHHWWVVNKRRTRIRVRITASGAIPSFVLRTLELLTRDSGPR